MKYGHRLGLRIFITTTTAEPKVYLAMDNTLKCLSIGTPKNNEFSICPKWKIHYFEVSQNLGRVQPHYNVLEYWDP